MLVRTILALCVALSGCDMGTNDRNKNAKDPANKEKPSVDNVNLKDLKLRLKIPASFDIGKETPFKLQVTLDGEIVDGLELGHISSWSYRCEDHSGYEIGSDDTILLDSNGETELKFVIKPNDTGDGSWKNCRIVAIVEMEYGDDNRTVTVESDVFVVNAASCTPDAQDSGMSISTQPQNTVIGRKLNLAVTGATTVRLGIAGCNGLSLVHWGTGKAGILTSETDMNAADLGQLHIVASNGINSIPDNISGCKIRVRSPGVCVTNSVETASFNVTASPSKSMSHQFIEAYEYGGRAILSASIAGVKKAANNKYFFAQNNQAIHNVTDRVFNNQIISHDPAPKITSRETIKDMSFLFLNKSRDEALIIKARASGCGMVREDLRNEDQAYRCYR